MERGWEGNWKNGRSFSLLLSLNLSPFCALDVKGVGGEADFTAFAMKRRPYRSYQKYISSIYRIMSLYMKLM
jgi:hypothetical protein